MLCEVVSVGLLVEHWVKSRMMKKRLFTTSIALVTTVVLLTLPGVLVFPGSNITSIPSAPPDVQNSLVEDSDQISPSAGAGVSYLLDSISSLRKGLDMVTWFLSKETKSHAQAHKRGYSNNSI